MNTSNQPSVAAGRAALDAHRNYFGLDGDTPVQLWHLFLSLHELCLEEGLDFDRELADFKADLASGEVKLQGPRRTQAATALAVAASSP